MKKLLALALALCLLVCLSGCDSLIPDSGKTPEPVDTAIPFTQRYADSLNILIIGNSHSIDAFHLLYQAYKDQYPDVDLTVGILHYGGACIDEHVAFFESGDDVMRYYKNADGKWKVKYHVTSKYVMKDVAWDVILTQPAKEDLSDETLNLDGRRALEEQVNKYLKTPHEFMWHISWPSPNDETFFSPDYIRQPPEGYKKKLTRLYGFNPVTQFGVMLTQTKNHILGDDHYTQALCSGSAVMHAHLTQGRPQLELWRDYTHLSDYGRLMASYALVAQLTQEPITHVGIDVISEGWLHKQNQGNGHLYITEEMKQVLMEAVNYSIDHPWDMPEKTDKVVTVTTTRRPTTTTRRPTTTTTTKATTTTATTVTTTTQVITTTAPTEVEVTDPTGEETDPTGEETEPTDETEVIDPETTTTDSDTTTTTDSETTTTTDEAVDANTTETP